MSERRKRLTPQAVTSLADAPKGSIAHGFAEEEAKAKSKNKDKSIPYRFYVKKNHSAEVMILDAEFDGQDNFSRQEHNLMINGKYGNYEPCHLSGGSDSCPHCEAGSKSYMVMLLTVIELTPYQNGKGETIDYSRRILQIKRGSFSKFASIAQAVIAEHGTLRGTVLNLSRGDDDKSPNIGEPTPYQGGIMYDFMTEEEIIAEYGHPALKTREQEVYCEENGMLKALNYLEAFPEPTEGESSVDTLGSDAYISDAIESEDAPPSSGRARRSASTPVVEAEVVEPEDDDIPF